MSVSYRRIPYGVANFFDIRKEQQLYVDKTRFIPTLEQYAFVFLIRPRRFGKSCWMSTLYEYYDRSRAKRFDLLFGDLDIAKNPTGTQHHYVTLHFDFSRVDDALETLEEVFERYVGRVIKYACMSHPDLFPESVIQEILSSPKATEKLDELFFYAKRQGIPLYVLIDEYDNFANTILAQRGEAAYHEFTHGEGFYRNFFAMLKGGASSGEGGLKRLFITGVSPVTMDDVTSGFNVGTNISRMSEFNELLGFTEAEVRQILAEYQKLGVFDHDIEDTINLMKEWYNGYRFAEGITTDLYNTDMVLYYLRDSVPNKRGPRELIDNNIRIDYSKLRHLMWVNRKLNGNFDVLQEIMNNGTIVSNLVSSFPIKRITDRENFISLLYYFGLLTMDKPQMEKAVLKIPNRTVADLMYGYLRAIYQEADIFRVNINQFTDLIYDIGLNGNWEPLFTFLANALKEQTSIRDYLQGEKMVQGFLLTYFNLTTIYECRSEWERAKGYVDIFLIPDTYRFPDLKYGVILELKYLKRGESLNERLLQESLEEGREQVQRYLQQDRFKPKEGPQYIGLLLVFHGWELTACEQVVGNG